MRRKTSQSIVNVKVLGVLLLGLISCAGYSNDQAQSLSGLDLACRRMFGEPYWSGKLPADSFATPSNQVLHSSRNLKVALTGVLVNLRFAPPKDIVADLERRLAEDPHDSYRMVKLAFAFTEWSRRQHLEGGGSFWPQQNQWRRMLSWMLSQPEKGTFGPADIGSSEWLRLRFLIQGALDSHPKLIPLGRSLLASQPNDLELSLTQCFQLALSNTLADTAEAIRMSEACQTKWPNAALIFLNEENIAYYRRWSSLGRKKKDLLMAIQTVEKILAKLPPSGLERQQAEGQLWSLKTALRIGRPLTAKEIFAHSSRTDMERSQH